MMKKMKRSREFLMRRMRVDPLKRSREFLMRRMRPDT